MLPCFLYIYDESGAEAIRRMSNFDAINFETVWNNVGEILSRNYNVGREIKVT